MWQECGGGFTDALDDICLEDLLLGELALPMGCQPHLGKVALLGKHILTVEHREGSDRKKKRCQAREASEASSLVAVTKEEERRRKGGGGVMV